jgi:hypothetical protein
MLAGPKTDATPAKPIQILVTEFAEGDNAPFAGQVSCLMWGSSLA